MQVVMGDLTGYPQMRGKVMEGGQPWHFQTEVSGLSTGKRGDEGERTTLTFSKQKCQGCPRALCPFPDGNGPGRAPEDHWNTNKTVHSKNGQRVARAYASCYGRLYRLPAHERGGDGERTTLTFSKRIRRGYPRERGETRERGQPWHFPNRNVRVVRGPFVPFQTRMARAEHEKIIGTPIGPFIVKTDNGSRTPMPVVMGDFTGIPKSYLFYIVLNQTIFDSGIPKSHFL